MTDQFPVIVWFREDLRINYNPALSFALSLDKPILCLYLYDIKNQSVSFTGKASKWWLHHSLLELNKTLEQFETKLLIQKTTSSLNTLINIISTCKASMCVWNRVYAPNLIKRDIKLKSSLVNYQFDHLKETTHFIVKSFNGSLLIEPRKIVNKKNNPYLVFTPFWKKLETHLTQQAADLDNLDFDLLSGLNIRKKLQLTKFHVSDDLCSDNLDNWNLLPKNPNLSSGFQSIGTPGEFNANDRWQSFVKSKLNSYSLQNDYPNMDATSGLSISLKYGEISTYQLYIDLLKIDHPSANKFLLQLAWREFSFYHLYHFPHIIDQPLYEKYQGFPFRKDKSLQYQAWCKGNTGFPIVDAAMRQLYFCGWMHNRLRMIVGSLLCKNLLIDWKLGAHWFFDTLLDGCIANNISGWQWVAGTGADTAANFRIFNPILQSRKFDSQGEYIKKWVVELKDLPIERIHDPWQILQKDKDQKMLDVVEATGYPRPIVDLFASRANALEVYNNHLKTKNTRN